MRDMSPTVCNFGAMFPSAACAAVAWSPDGSMLAFGSVDWNARIWHTSSGSLKYTLRGHASAVSSVAWSPDGSLLATGSADGTVRVWQVARGKTTRVIKIKTFPRVLSVLSVAWSQCGQTVLAATQNAVTMHSLSEGC